MAQSAREKAEQAKQMEALMKIVGLIVFLPFLIFTYFAYRSLKNQYLAGPEVRRVVDKSKAFQSLFASGMCLIGWVVVSFIAGSWLQGKDIPILNMMIGGVPLAAISPIILATLALPLGIIMARSLAVSFLGIVVDPTRGCLFLPDRSKMEKIPLSSITQMTRGGHGKELYIHGDFGSRSIAMSNKQKRDEVQALIQSLSC